MEEAGEQIEPQPSEREAAMNHEIPTIDRLPKTRRAPDAFLGRKVTVRSLRIIETIARCRFIKTSSILRLVRGNEDVTYRHLQMLYHQGYVSRIQSPLEGNNAEFVYFLSNAAKIREIAQDKRFQSDLIDFESIRSNRSKYSPENPEAGDSVGRLLFLEREVMISTFHALVVAGCASSQNGVNVECWKQGPASWQHLQKEECEKMPSIPHRADAYFILHFPNSPEDRRRKHFFYETERDTTNTTRFKAKLAKYIHFFNSGTYSEKYGARKGRAVLIETTSIARMNQLMRVAREITELEPLTAALFWFSASGVIRGNGVFGAVWECCGDSRRRSLLD